MQTKFSGPRDSVVLLPQPAPVATGPEAATDTNAGMTLNADLLASLPKSELDALVPEPAAVAINVNQPSWFGIIASLQEGPWRETLRGGDVSGGKLVRSKTLKEQALGVAHDGGTEVTLSQAAVARDLAQRARGAGLSNAEADLLQSILLKNGHFDSDADLVRALLETDNPARALHTFINLDGVRQNNTQRITPEIMRELALGVGLARTDVPEGKEGILSNESAVKAAKALSGMRPADYERITEALGAAGGVNGPATPFGADAQTERALILKAVAARADRLSEYAYIDANTPSSACEQVTRFAWEIRGSNAHYLVEHTSGIDLDGDGVDEALQQRWQNASALAVLQMAQAEADPIFAWKLHNEVLHDTSSTDSVASDQEYWLEVLGGDAIERRDAPGGGGDMVVAAMEKADWLLTDSAYERIKVKPATRASALDHIEYLAREGADVPIAVSSEPGRVRAMLVTDVRGAGNTAQFLVTDPWSGRTEWVSRGDFVAGNVGGTSETLTDYWV
jgi:hypothetical protein